MRSLGAAPLLCPGAAEAVWQNGSVTAARSPQVTALLKAWAGGDKLAYDELFCAVHDELRRMAKRAMRREGPGHTLQTTALVNESYLRLVDVDSVDWKDRAHFFAVAAQTMRRILVDAARARAAAKRGAGAVHVSLDGLADASAGRVSEILVLDEALDRLGHNDPRKVQVVELRFFGGLSVKETAEVLKISPQSVMRDWKLAKAWVLRELSARH